MKDPRGTEQAIGSRISYSRNEDSMTITIDQGISRAQQWGLEIWLIAWLGAGGAMASQIAEASDDERLFYMVYLAFWVFFLFRVIKVTLWRRIGREMIRVSAKGMSVKNAIGSWGKAQFFHIKDIERMEVIKRDPKAFMANLDQSFWIMGGDSVQFTHLGKRFVLGKQLSMSDALALTKLIHQAFKRFR